MFISRCNDYKILDSEDDNLREAARRLIAGDLVAFPTETVYGLGASALSEEAVKKIFVAKGRPFSDPLIVHVSNLEMAYSLCDLSSGLHAPFDCLTRNFWPGPLTIIVPSSSLVPQVVTGGGETVGIRCPGHPVAQRIISFCGIPLAAPSANRFGHVSPTLARHVAEDLGRDGLLIIDGGPCSVGIESTVVKIMSANELLILRRGALSSEAIKTAFARMGINIQVTFRDRFVEHKEKQDSPGELLIHYSPNLPTYLLIEDSPQGELSTIFSLSMCGLVDLGGRFAKFREHCGAYKDLSVTGNLNEACENLFNDLRIMEEKNIQAIILPDLRCSSLEIGQALADRLNRAAALKEVRIVNLFVQVVS